MMLRRGTYIPSHLLAGKIIALGAVGLFQTLVWSGAGLLLLRVSGSTLGVAAAFQLPVTILAYRTLAVALSLFPLTAPVAMMTRLSAGVIPAWQIALSAGLLVATVVLILRAVAGMFRAQALLSGQSFNLKRFARALTGKAA